MNQAKRILVCSVLALAVAAGAFAQYQPMDEKTANAFSVSMQAYIFCAMMGAFGQTPAGSTVETVDNDVTITFNDLDLASLGVEDEDGYATISGSIVGKEVESGSDINADLTLTGGPIKSLNWSVDGYDVTGASEEVVFIIIADGKRYRMAASDFE